MSPHLDSLVQRKPEMYICAQAISSSFELMRDSQRAGGTILLAGNGGSAADADHWSGELLKGFAKRRPLSETARRCLSDELGNKLQGAMRAIPLHGFSALNTAFANDVDPDLTYAQLVWALGRSGDVFVGMSTSGNARNICFAAETARARGLSVIGLTGQGGGALKNLCDVCISVPATETYQVQELHLPTYHCLSFMLEEEFFDQQAELEGTT